MESGEDGGVDELYVAMPCAYTYHSVLLPVSPAYWYSGKEGTTVGTGETVLVVLVLKAVAVAKAAKAWAGSTMLAMASVGGLERSG